MCIVFFILFGVISDSEKKNINDINSEKTNTISTKIDTLLIKQDTDTGKINFEKTTTSNIEKEISYEFHKRKGGIYDYNKSFYKYSAIIKSINPSKDDFKAYCRYIVKDIAKKCGSNIIVVDIYDNIKAFSMDENAHFNPSTKQYEYIKQHTVGQYTGVITEDIEANNFLVYYMDCDNTSLSQFQSREKIDW